MTTPFPAVPWNTPELWLEANDSLKHSLCNNKDAMGACLRLTSQLLAQLASIFPIMDRLCRIACPACIDVCCHHALVWIDFRDLLFLHLAAIPVPEEQLLGRRGERCRYSSSIGCRLDREQRPFVCTWYLCPAQTRCLREEPSEMQKTMACLQRIKHLRREMEKAFIGMVG